MNIIITGASKGIGYELTKLFAQHKDNYILTIARDKKLLDDLKNDCLNQNYEGIIEIMPFDLTSTENVKNKLINDILSYLDSVDILINNAGYLTNKPFEKISIDEIHKTFNVNVISHAVLIQGLIPLLKKSKIGHVINISSMGGFQGSSKFPGLSFYSSSKAAIASLTECLAAEYKNENIRFNALALGAVNTKMLNTAFPGFKAPLNPNEMAEFIYDFSLNGFKYYNGKILPVSLSTP